MISSGIFALVGTMFGAPILGSATTPPSSSDFLTELGTYLTSLVDWAGDVLTTVWDNQILRVVVFLTIPLIGIGILARLMRL